MPKSRNTAAAKQTTASTKMNPGLNSSSKQGTKVPDTTGGGKNPTGGKN
jgi:hypothetical protein